MLLHRWDEMKKGTPQGVTYCARVMVSTMQDLNKAMRDPVIYRCNVETPHARTGFKYKVRKGRDFYESQCGHVRMKKKENGQPTD